MSNYGKYTAEYKAKIIIEALREAETISEIGARENLSPKMVGNWKREFIQNAYRAFCVTKDEKKAQEAAQKAEEREQGLMAKIGQLTYELDWVKKKYEQSGFGRENGANRQK